jgi:hypothetical protein
VYRRTRLMCSRLSGSDIGDQPALSRCLTHNNTTTRLNETVVSSKMKLILYVATTSLVTSLVMLPNAGKFNVGPTRRFEARQKLSKPAQLAEMPSRRTWGRRCLIKVWATKQPKWWGYRYHPGIIRMAAWAAAGLSTRHLISARFKHSHPEQ